MDFELPPRSAALVHKIREFLAAELFPLERRMGEGFTALEPALDQIRAKVKAQGWWAPAVPQKHGGMGLSLLEFAPVGEELGRTPFGHYCFNVQAPDIGNIEILIRHGTEAQKRRFLDPLVRGEVRSCFSMTEPGRPGSNPTWMDTQAKREPDGWVINGRKWFTSSADGAAFAVVMTVTDWNQQNPTQRASQLLVPTDTPGFRRVRNIPVMGDAGSGYASHAEVVYENCKVPLDALLGEPGSGFAIAQERLGPGRVHHCMRWIGICERALDLLCRRATQREIAPGKTLATRHVIREWIAEARAEINAARWMVLHAAWRMDKEGSLVARDEISLAKFFVAGVLQKTVDRSLQAHGALGMTDETPLAYWYSHERAARIYDGPDEVHKASVARRILEGYRSDA